MKIFVLSPNIKTLFNEQQISQIKQSGDAVFQEEIIPLDQLNDLFAGDAERVLAIDPDFSNWSFPNEVFDRIPNLKAVVLQTTSFSWVDVTHLQQKGIPVINLRGFSKIAVAEYILMMTTGLARRLPLIVKDKWQPDYIKHKGIELRGKTAGVIGLGNIGTAVAENFLGLGMKVVYWSKNSRDDRFQQVELQDLMASSDVIVPAVAQNKETAGLITDNLLKSMKKTTVFVSAIHNVYNHDLLLEMVKNGELFGYGFEDSNAKLDDFVGNVWPVPELAWCTQDSFEKNASQWTEAIVAAAKDIYTNQVN